MALIDCTECGKQVSDRATACPGCGNPITAAIAPLSTASAFSSPAVEVVKVPVVTTEATGKSYKGAQLVGMGIICVGLVSCAAGAGPGFGAAMTVVGGIVYLGAGAMAWWDHG